MPQFLWLADKKKGTPQHELSLKGIGEELCRGNS